MRSFEHGPAKNKARPSEFLNWGRMGVALASVLLIMMAKHTAAPLCWWPHQVALVRPARRDLSYQVHVFAGFAY